MASKRRSQGQPPFIEEGSRMVQELPRPKSVKKLFTERHRRHQKDRSEKTRKRPIANHSERIVIDLEENELHHDTIGRMVSISDGSFGDCFDQGSARDSLMRSWTRQVLISDVYPLSLHEKQKGHIYSILDPSDVHRAWFNSTLSFQYIRLCGKEREVQADLFEVGSTHGSWYLEPITLNTVGYHDGLLNGVKFRWMHLKVDLPDFPVFGLLEDLVDECPSISNHLKSVALKVVREASEQHSEGPRGNPEVCTGNLIRYVGRHQAYLTHDDSHYDHTWDTEPVMFVSTPFLTVERDKAKNRSSSEDLPRSPLEFIYGAGSKNDQPFWLAEATVNAPKLHITRMMRVHEASFLLIGSEILISISRVPWNLMLPAEIAINREGERPPCEFYSVQVIANTEPGNDSITIWKGCSYGDFLRKALGLSQDAELNLSSYTLVDESNRPIGQSAWSKYLKSGEVEKHAFKLIYASSDTSTVNSDMPAAAPPAPWSQKLNKISPDSSSVSVVKLTVVYYLLPDLPPKISTYRAPNHSSFEILYHGHGRIIMNHKDITRALLETRIDLGECSKQKFECFLSQSLGQNTIESLVIDGDVELRQLQDKLQQSILQTPYTDLLTYSSACTRDSVYDRCQILCLVTENELSPLAFEHCGPKHSACKIHRPYDILKLQSIFTLSDEIFSYFLPASSTVATHSVSKRYWGALDLVIRQIYLSTLLIPKCGQFAISPLLSFVSHGDLGIALKDLPDDGCEHCRNGAVYSCIHDAVNHLHQHHIACHTHNQDTSMLNDPCTIWVYSKLLDPALDEEAFELASSFYRDLMKMLDNVKGIRASKVVDDWQMKVSLGHYFSSIICRFLLAAAHSLSTNEARLEDSKTDVDHNEYELSYINGQIDAVNDKLKEQFRLVTYNARISETARIDIDHPITPDIGPELLLANLITNLQIRAIDLGTGSRMDATGFCHILHLAGQPTAVKDLQRKRILKISALEEEMEALRVITEIQRRVNKAYRKVLGPGFFQHDTTDDEYIKNRSKSHILESRLLDRHAKFLSRNTMALERMMGIGQATRYKMKQLIELSDEGHGKAIRVFTFVTLFFLPLSFVTSFLGMNTTDIRDTEWDQRIFWSSAVPLTAMIICLAWIYGYQWDTVMDFWHSLPHQFQDFYRRHRIRGKVMRWMRRLRYTFKYTVGRRGKGKQHKSDEEAGLEHSESDN